MYFCAPSPNGSILKELKVNLFGDIEDWPEDFFGDPMADISARLAAAAAREAEIAGD
jgi:predicted ATPase